MFEISFFAQLYCTSKYTIRRRIKKILPILKGFNPKKRMRTYTLEQGKDVIRTIGFPPENKFTEQIRSKYPILFE